MVLFISTLPCAIYNLEKFGLAKQIHFRRTLAHDTKNCKYSSKKIVVKIVANIKTVEKNFCCCEKKQCVWKITAFFAVLCVVCEGVYDLFIEPLE